jgi:hypothetical protein
LSAVTLRENPVERFVTLPDGRMVTVRVGLAEDGYLAPGDLDTVALTLREGDEVLAALNTLLEPEHEREARVLATEISSGLAAGTLEPTAGALEPLADTIPPVRDRG